MPRIVERRAARRAGGEMPLDTVALQLGQFVACVCRQLIFDMP
jgi:hypothetical protein